MAVANVGTIIVGTGTNTASSNHNLPMPTGLQDGDWLYIQWTANNTRLPTFTGVSGVETVSATTQNGSVALYRTIYRFPVTAAMSGTNINANTPAIVRCVMSAIILRGASSTYSGISYAGGTTANTTVSIPALTSVAGNGLSVFFLTTNHTVATKNNVFTDPSGWSSLGDASFGSATPYLSGMLSALYQTGGSHAAVSATTTLSSTKLGYRLFVPEAGVVTTTPFRGWGIPAK